MARERKNDSRVIELTSLIDVVFLLLIFFLVTFALTLSGAVSESEVSSQLDLPETQSVLPMVTDETLENLMIQITPDTTDNIVRRAAHILWPALKDTVGISTLGAMRKAQRDSTFASFPKNFASLSDEEFESAKACTLISNSISRYVEAHKLYGRRVRPLVEVRAARDTEFRILSFIMNQCSAQGDLIPQIVIRTTHSMDKGRSEDRGI